MAAATELRLQTLYTLFDGSNAALCQRINVGPLITTCCPAFSLGHLGAIINIMSSMSFLLCCDNTLVAVFNIRLRDSSLEQFNLRMYQ